MIIATYLNEAGEVSGFHESGSVFVFEERPDHWALLKCVPYDLDGPPGLAAIKRAIAELAAAAAPCRVLITNRLHGLPYALLQEEYGFRLWTSEGPVMSQLDHVARREREVADAAAQDAGGCCPPRRPAGIPTQGSGPPPEPEPVGLPAARHYRLDLDAALSARPDLNSREVLLPVLYAGDFAELDVVCDHLPRWLPQALSQLGLAADIGAPAGTPPMITARVFGPKDGKMTGRPPLRVLQGGCGGGGCGA